MSASSLSIGIALVFGTWLLCLGWAVGYGRWLVICVSGQGTTTPDRTWRISLWWGLASLTSLVLLVSIFFPLGSPSAAWTLVFVLAVSVGIGLALQRPSLPRWRPLSAAASTWMAASLSAFAYLAFKALGPVTNYDSGLYHLGAIKYAYEYAAIPGLANLYFPFGYSNAQFPLAALLGNGPWDGIGYRLLNGAVLGLALADLTSRLLNRRRTWGTFTLLFGLSASLIPMVAMADDMVTSPTADTSVMLLTVVTASYLADALQFGTSAPVDAATAVTTAGLTVAFRPTMIVFAIGVLLVAILSTLRKQYRPWPQIATWTITAALLSVLAVVSLLRDRILSGWLFYPLSTFPLPVPWLADDPARWRIGTLAAARDPGSLDGFQTAHSYEWITSWFARLPSQWEPWFLLVGFIIALQTLVVAWRAGVMNGVWSRMMAALIPSALAIAAWFFFSPPSFRFIWGPVLALLVVPLGIVFGEVRNVKTTFVTGQSANKLALIASAVCIGSVTVFSLAERNQFDTITQERFWRLGPISVGYAVTPIPLPATTSVDVGNGLIIQTPTNGDQCWDNYPLCVYFTGQSIAPRGPSIQDGFVHG